MKTISTEKKEDSFMSMKIYEAEDTGSLSFESK
jgi:hypothetical protein